MQRQKRNRTLGIMAAVCTAPLLAGSAFADSPRKVLEDLAGRREKLRTIYHKAKTVTRQGSTEQAITTETWMRHTEHGWQSRSETSMSSIAGAGGMGQDMKTTSVNDGRHEWQEIRVGDTTMVFKGKAKKRDPLEEVRSSLKNGDARITGREKVKGVSCIVLEIGGPDRRDGYHATYWISQAHGVLLKSVVKHSDRTRMEMNTLKFEVNESIDESKFVYTPAPGVTVVDTEAEQKAPGRDR